jgi:cell division protease FtsH
MALHCPNADPIHKLTIAPRGRALGMLVQLPEGDRVGLSLAKLEDQLAVATGGRAAEEIVFGRAGMTTGAAADIEAATDRARRMVTEWGMSEKIGFVRLAPMRGAPAAAFVSPNTARSPEGDGESHNPYLDAPTTAQVNAEVKAITDRALERSRTTLTTYRAALDALAHALLDRETLSGEEIRSIATEAGWQAA